MSGGRITSVENVPHSLLLDIVSYIGHGCIDSLNELIVVSKLFQSLIVEYARLQLSLLLADHSFQFCSDKQILNILFRLQVPLIILVGGYNDHRRCDALNLRTLQFKKCCSLSLKRSDEFEVVSHNNSLMAISGCDESSIGTLEQYNWLHNSWMTVRSLSSKLVAMSAASNGDNIFVIGGFERQSMERTDCVIMLQNSTADCDSASSLVGRLLQRRSHHASVVAGCSLWVVGGLLHNKLHATNSVEEFCTSSGKSASGPPMLRCRYRPRLFVIQGVLYAVGGDMEGFQHSRVSTIESLRLGGDTSAQWEHVTDIPDERLKCASCAYQSKIFVFGGGDGESSRTWDCFDLEKQRWASAAQPATERLISSRKSAVKSSIAVLLSL